MKNILYLLLMFPIFLFSQTEEKKETVYLLFDSNSKKTCKINVEQTYNNKKGVEIVKKFRKRMKGNTINRFYVCDEIFRLRTKEKSIDTCKTEELGKIVFKDIGYLNAKREQLKPVNFFKNSVFEHIYFIEPHKDYIIKYEVIWITDLIQN